MLKKLNRYIKSILEESANDNDEKKIRDMYHCNEFFIKYLAPLAEECKIVATKQRQNCFLVQGSLKNLNTFFSKLAVDDDFMDNPSEFKIYTPMFSYGEFIHNLKMDEDYPETIAPWLPPQTHDLDNISRQTIHGRWYSFHNDDDGKKLKGVKPAEICRYFKELFPKADSELKNDLEILIEFQVNCEDWKNQIYDEMSEYAKEPDEMNEYHNEDPDDFDYTQLNVKNVNDDAIVKNALKEIKRTDKDYSNK